MVRNPHATKAIRYVRRRRREQELELVLELGRVKTDTRVLDIGCGAAYQSAIMRQRGYDVVCGDVKNSAIFTYLDTLFDCCYLPFKDKSFRIVYSSHLLEHVHDKSKALREMIRVLGPAGSIYVIVPTRLWKIGQLLSYYPELLVLSTKRASKLLSRLTKRISTDREREPDMSIVPTETGSTLRRLYSKARRYVIPSVHGTALSNLEELRSFRMSNWLQLFKDNGLNVNKVIMGPLWMPGPISLPPIMAKRLGMSSSFIFEMSYKQTEHN
jgi:ubiquinone/menaquinone biosynthesis C-methylase UbiE